MKKTIMAAALAATFAVGANAQEPLTAPGPAGDLAGTLIRPAEGGAVVIIIPGSGPTDRDGNNPGGITASSYRLLAEALHARGIGSLRIDKRGMFGSKAAIADPNAVTYADYAQDVARWVEAARRASGNDCVWVAGHSEGGSIALLAAQSPQGICGVILLAAPANRFSTILRKQLSANPANAPILPDALTAIDSFEKGERVDVANFHPALQAMFAPAVQGFLIDAMRYDPADLAAKLAVPLLVIQGEADIQVPRENGDALAKAQPDARYVVLPAMNHVLKAVPAGDMQANLAAYADPSRPVMPEIVDAIAGFVTAPHAQATKE
ncbi:Alpha/beta hydrolase family protein [Tsuneonella dongtanensis]|uniref:Alpha/beta hydrolase family protein n=1 Tax=Tsuneonella dongtanensis TaxID=692370 RepID=A0A1B2A9W7_9SPHN|nr:alpha/beta fold hydrolase [Tsuneonella dongtanensis]ANY18845.1 Alpha/beta hydrolase family protein [Tsuneonella dongtanensis]